MSPLDMTLAIIAAIITVYMIKKEINIGYVMLLDSVFITVIARIPAMDALKYALKGAFSEKTIMLILLLFVIMMLENIMRTSGMISMMVNSLKELLGNNRLAAAFLPAVIGIMPSPGGARFSCPMLEELLGDSTDNGNKAFINYWFRHLWLDASILYPGFILASQLLGITPAYFFIYMLPFIMIHIILGFIFGTRHIKRETIIRTRSFSENLKIFLTAMSPVIVLITLYMFMLKYTSFALEIATALVVTTLFIIKKFSRERILQTMKEAFPVKFVILLVGVMIFKEIIQDSGLMNDMNNFFRAHNIPVVALFILLPMLAGFATSITISCVSITFPLLLPLGMDQSLWYAALAFISIFIGGMITPVHLCAAMSVDYFKAALGKLLVKVTYVEAAFLAASLVFVFIMV